MLDAGRIVVVVADKNADIKPRHVVDDGVLSAAASGKAQVDVIGVQMPGKISLVA